MAKHVTQSTPRPLADAQRLAELRRLQVMDSPAEPGFDRITAMAARVLAAPVCLVSLVDDRRQFFKSLVGLGGWAGEARETPLSHSFCQHVVTSGAPLVVEDAPGHPLVCENRAITELGVIAYLGVPIRAPGGAVLGSFCVIDGKARTWTEAEVALVTEFAALVETEISLRAEVIERETVAARQRAVLDGANFSVIATDLDGVIDLFNAGAEKMLGYKAAEVVGKVTPAVIHRPEEVVSRAAELSVEFGRPIEPGFAVFTMVALARGSEEREWTYVRKDGSTFPVSLTVTALRNAEGVPTGFLGVARDLSERREAQAKLKAAKSRLEKIFSSMSEGVVLQDSDGRILEHNAAALEILGLTTDQLCGRSSLDAAWHCVHADGTVYRGEDHPAMVTLRTGKGMRDALMGVHRADGSLVWVEVNTELIGVVDDPERRAVTSFRDVTARRLAAERLAESERLLSQITGKLPGLVAYWSVDLRCVFANAEYLKWFGRTPEQMKGITMLELIGPERFEANREHLVGVLGGRPQRFERLIPQVDGALRQVWVQYVPDFAPDGVTVRGFVGLVSDISETKAQEQALRASQAELARQKFALDEHALVTVTDVDGIITYANDKVSELSGFTREELLGKDHRIFNSGHHPKAYFAALHRVISRGDVWRGEMCNRTKDGRLVWWDTTIVPFKSDDDRIASYVAIRTDTTVRKDLGQKLERARDQALEASRLKSEFLANMSHEIRTPMNGIIGMAGLLMDMPLNEAQREMGSVILSSAEVLLAILNDILDFSKMEAGKLSIHTAPFALRPVVEETLLLLAPRAHEKQLELTCDFSDDLPVDVCGDSGRIRQVLLNLVGNAIKFTARGEVVVRAVQVRADAGRSRVRVSVHDSGIGIPLAAQATLFQPFTQADGSVTKRFGGTGLGLAISRQLVDLMGGEIGFESAPGIGSTFWFELELPVEATKSAPPAEAPGVPAGTRVLVVDDHEANRRILVGQLAHLGITAQTAGDAESAFAELRAQARAGTPYHLALLDWNMPRISGLELATTIRTDPTLAGLRLIMLSSGGPGVGREHAPEGLFAACIDKPVRETDLHGCVRRALAAAASPAARRSLHILVVEDNPANQLVARMLLQKAGHTVEIVDHGQHALDWLAAHTCDLVLMDCQMPVLDGYEATRRIRRGDIPGIDPRVMVVAVTAFAMADDRRKCLDAGMDYYVTKPLRVRELEDVLARAGLSAGVAVTATSTTAAPLSVAANGGQSTPAAQAQAPVVDVLDPVQVETLRQLPGRRGPRLFPELLEVFWRDTEPRLRTLHEATAIQDAATVARIAHTMAGSCASVGAREAGLWAKSIERAVKAGAWDEAREHLAKENEVWTRLREALDAVTTADLASAPA